MTSLLRRTVEGIGKTAFLTVAKSVVDFTTLMVIIRILHIPDPIGDLFWVLVWIEIFHYLSNFGGYRYLIQRREMTDADLATVTTTESGSALLWAAAWFFSAPALLTSVGWGHVSGLALIMTPWLLTERLAQPARALLERDLKFGRSNGAMFLGTLVMSVVAIALALSGFGVKSLLIGRVAQSATAMAMMWVFAGRFPKFGWSRDAFRPYVKFGAPLFASDLLQLYYKRIPDIIIGVWLKSPAIFGIYSVAVRLPDYLRQIQDLIGAVVYPAFTKTSSDEKLREGFHLATKYSAVMGLLPLSLVLVLGDGVTRHLLTESYAGITHALQIFTGLAVFRIITNHWYFAYLAKGRTAALPLLALLNSTGVTIGAVVGIKWGITGVAIGVATTNACVILIAINAFLRRELEVRYIPMLTIPLMIAAVTIVAGFVMVVAGLNVESAVQFWSGVAVMTAVYGLAILLIDATSLRELRRSLRA